MEPDTKSVAASVRSRASKAPSQAPSKTSTQVRAEELKQEEILVEAIRSKYVPLLEKEPNKYVAKMVGLNPNMRPPAKLTQSKIFPMQGLWSAKKLMCSTN